MNAGVVLSFHGSLEAMVKKNKNDLERVSEFRLFRKLSKNFNRVYVFSHDSKDYSMILPDNFVHVKLRNRLFYILFGWLAVLYFTLRQDIRLIYAECGPALPPLFMVNKLTRAWTHMNYDYLWYIGLEGFRKYPIKLFEKFLLNFVDSFVVASSEISDFVGKRNILPVKKGIAVEEFDPRKVKRNPVYSEIKGKVVIYTGRLEPVKDPVNLIKAFDIAKKQVKDAHLLMAGDGSLRSECEKLSGKDVHFLGFVKDVPSLLKGADIFVLPSLYDASPRSVMEAMSMGLPTVATKTGGVPDYLDNTSGIMVRPKDPEKLAEAIVSLLKDPKKAKVMGSNARKKMLRDHDIEKNIEKLLNILKKSVRG